MELSGLIFVALALVWAVVLIPKALRHHDELAETRSVDAVSDEARVLARREAVSRSEAALIVGPAAVPRQRQPATSSLRPEPAAERRQEPRDQLKRRRAAAAAAARKRRRVLTLLLVVTAAIGVASGLGHLLPWAPVVPAAVVVLFLVVARVTVRRDNARWAALVASARSTGPAAEAVDPSTEAQPARGVESASSAPASASVPAVEPDVAPVVRNEQGLAVVSGLDDTSSIPVVVARLSADREPSRLWDPVPVTLPTYVSKPRASRSVRTIDLTAPGIASSGRDSAASALVAEAATSAEGPGSGSRAIAT